MKDFRVRYRYAVMGFLWAILEPLLVCVILTVVFSFVFQIKSVDPSIASRWDFAALLLCALLPWQFTSDVLGQASNALLDHQDIVKKLYFPREIVPLAMAGIAMVNFLIGLAVLFVLLSLFVQTPGPTLLFLPIIMAIQVALTVGIAFFLSVANLHYRDVGYMTRVALMMGFYATPIFYTTNTLDSTFSELSGAARWIEPMYYMNPMVGIVTAYRDVLVHHQLPDATLLLWPAIASAGALVAGAWFFRRNSGEIADLL